MNQEKKDKIEWVKQKILCNELTGSCMDRGCTDGFDTEITILALEIVEYFEKGAL